MKIAPVERPIDRIATKTEKQFTIKATGKAFRILSSGLYKDKILAIVRELSCNAYDAHIAAKKPKLPFEVHLPNHFEPYFSVRDKGPALSPEQIETVFTTYFESTKNDDNDQIGGLGLGCKSPLSYVDSFTVISWFEGVRRTYTVFFDEDDTPSMVEMACEPSDEPTGLEVKLPVRAESINEFRVRAESVYRYFDPKPIVTGSGEFKAQERKVVMQGPNYALVRGGQDARAIMGVVAYPLDSSSVELTYNGNQLLSTAIDMFFDVGDLDITAGREELGYDRRTKQAIVERVDEVLLDMTTRTVKEMAKCKNEFEARSFYGSVVNSFSVLRGLFADGKVPYRGRLIDSEDFVLNLFTEFKTMTFLKYDFDNLRPKFKTFNASTMAAADRVRIKASDNLTLIVDDMNGRETMTRIRQFHEDSPNSVVYLIRGSVEDIEAFRKRMTGAIFVQLSSLPKSPVAARAPTSVLRLNDKERRSTFASISRKAWHNATIDPSQGGIYLRTVSGSIQGENGHTMHDFQHFYRKCMELKLFDPSIELYAIPKSLSKQFDAGEGWVSFFDYIRERFVEKMTEENWAEGIAKSRELAKFKASYPVISERRTIISRVAGKLPFEHPLKEFCGKWGQTVTDMTYTTHTSMSETLGIPIPVGETHNITGMWRELEVPSKYPMMVHALTSNHWGHEDTVAADTAIYVINADRNCVPNNA